MLIIGERINTCRQSVMRAYAERNAGFIRNEALRQAEAGADVIDVNAGSGLDVEPENMAWANLYLDPMIEPLCLAHDSGLLAVDTLRELKAQLPQIKTVISLSGLSFGLPERKLLHCAFLPILMHEGLDAIFLDPADQRLMATFRAARTILGQDECCMQYIASHRDGGLANGGEGLRRDDRENPR